MRTGTMALGCHGVGSAQWEHPALRRVLRERERDEPRGETQEGNLKPVRIFVWAGEGKGIREEKEAAPDRQ